MKTITECISKRRSVRTYNGSNIDNETLERLMNFSKTITNPFDIAIDFKLLNAIEHGLNCPVISGTQQYIGGKVKYQKYANAAYGYSLQSLLLYAEALSLGTLWLGGTMNRAAYEKAMLLKDGEIMPCAAAIGYPSGKQSLRETMMRRAIKADDRMAFSELFFHNDFNSPLSKENAGKLLQPLEMVRLAPSAVNRQPWRVVLKDNTAHFYINRSKPAKTQLDMQMVDMGIALCHFELTAKELGLNIIFSTNEPNIDNNGNYEFLGSWKIIS